MAWVEYRGGLAAACAGVLALACGQFGELEADASEMRPNFVVIFADDLGWGDLGAYGAPEIETPNLDRMAAEGQRWTSFYVAAPVCSPSRGALLTGRHPLRTGLYGRRSRVLFPGDPGGLPADEVTLAEALRDHGYRTAMVGKWHLGDHPGALPLDHGFESFLGAPYSNDMDWTLTDLTRERARDAYLDPRVEYWNVPLYHDREIVERPLDQRTITRRLTEAATAKLAELAAEPFFLYVAHPMPHMPLFRSAAFAGRSRAGVYGDVIEEIDWSVGRILQTLRELGLNEKTLVVFTSDNGPWRLFRTHAGSAGPFRQGKGTTWEGGVRVPGIFWWPETIRPAVVHELGSAMDLMPTFLALAGIRSPGDRVLDGVDLSSTLLGTLRRGGESRRELSYYREGELYAYRLDRFKAHFVTAGAYGEGGERREHEPPLLYDLVLDPGEEVDVAARYPEVVAEIRRRAAEHRVGLAQQAPIFDLAPGNLP